MKQAYSIVVVLIFCFHTVSAQQPADSIWQYLVHPSHQRVLVAAHRGDWRNAPENSIKALQNVIRMGVDIMETDIRRTKDGVLILMHDETVDRTTSGTGRVADLTWDYLRTVTLRKGNGGPTEQHIPTLEEFMLAVKGKRIVINLDKSWSILDEVFAVLKKTGTLEQGLFKGSYPLPELRRRYGGIMDSIHYMPMVHPKDYQNAPDAPSHPDSYITGFYDHFVPAAFELDIDEGSSPVLLRAVPQVKALHASIWLNSLWASLCAGHEDEKAVSDPDANWGWLIALGADVIQTDNPVELLAYLRKRGLHP